MMKYHSPGIHHWLKGCQGCKPFRASSKSTCCIQEDGRQEYDIPPAKRGGQVPAGLYHMVMRKQKSSESPTVPLGKHASAAGPPERLAENEQLTTREPLRATAHAGGFGKMMKYRNFPRLRRSTAAGPQPLPYPSFYKSAEDVPVVLY